MKPLFLPAALVLLASATGACSSCEAGADDESDGQGGDGAQGGSSSSNGFNGSGGGAGGPPTDDCAENAKLVYVLSVDYELWSFNPTIPGTAAYQPVGPLACAATGAPQSMAVDRSGTAYVFYDSGQLFRVSTLDASCTATSYVHPVQQGFNQLGMGFTAAAPDSIEEQLYIVSPAFGLAMVDHQSYAVTQTGALVAIAELTGGPDARLFRFAASTADLGEISIGSWALSPIHTWSELLGTQAFAFSRYAGKFYLFTSPGAGIPSTTTEYDPVTNSSVTRDANVGFTIVGAGQSTCVPPPPPT